MFALLSNFMPHLVVVPVLVPLTAALLLLFFKESQRKTKIFISLLACLIQLIVTVVLFATVKELNGIDSVAYSLAGWPAPFGIVLVADLLSCLMLVLNSVIALCSLLFASARWMSAGVHFHALFQLFIMGLSGAFLTGDLFNLFVFFEIMLAASYGLQLHGSGRNRVVSGIHYIVINLVASALFLIGVALIYSISGSLNMADIAFKVLALRVSGDLDILFYLGIVILAIAFLIKAGMWPLNFWLQPTYTAAVPPVAASFAIMTKVGVYVLLRLSLLLFSGDSSSQDNWFHFEWLVYGGLITLAVASIGLLSSQRVGSQAAYSAIISSGILITVLSFAEPILTANTLYYLLISSIAVSMLFLLSDLLYRWRQDGSSFASKAEEEESPFLAIDLTEQKVNLDADEIILQGKAIPASTAFLGISFLSATLLIAGMPPLAGFLAKIGIFLGLFSLSDTHGFWAGTINLKWVFVALLIFSSIITMISMTRSGIRNFWASHDRMQLKLRWLEGIPVAILLFLSIVLTVKADAVMRYTKRTAEYLYQPELYINSVLTAQITIPALDDESNISELDRQNIAGLNND